MAKRCLECMLPCERRQVAKYVGKDTERARRLRERAASGLAPTKDRTGHSRPRANDPCQVGIDLLVARGNSMSRSEVAVALGVTIERVKQIETSALRKFRARWCVLTGHEPIRSSPPEVDASCCIR
jgi:hypothetical protein